MTNKPAIVLLSGGIDSATVLALMLRAGWQVHALSFNYGQRNLYELELASKIARDNNLLAHHIVQMPLSSVSRSALLDARLSLDESNCAQDQAVSSYVPARNTLFLSYALAYAESHSINDVFVGANADDRANYPDCRSEYFDSFAAMANSGSHLSNFQIHSPLIKLNKVEIVRLGTSLSVDFSRTVSCYQASCDQLACGECAACQLRAEAFAAVGISDPIFITEP